ncbi:hypothetical protein KUCAC02_013131, partial [Chaenocephalus aceratus]
LCLNYACIQQSLLNIVDDEHHNLSTREEARQAYGISLTTLRQQQIMSPTVSDEYRADTQRKRKRKRQAYDSSEPVCELSGRSRFHLRSAARSLQQKYSIDLEEEFVEEAVHFREL